MLELFQDNSKVSLEGYLQAYGVLNLPNASMVETNELQRQTISPLLDFVIYPVTPDLITALKSHLPDDDAFGENGSVIHICISRNESLVFSAADNFYPVYTWVRSPRAKKLLEKLKNKSAIKDYYN